MRRRVKREVKIRKLISRGEEIVLVSLLWAAATAEARDSVKRASRHCTMRSMASGGSLRPAGSGTDKDGVGILMMGASVRSPVERPGSTSQLFRVTIVGRPVPILLREYFYDQETRNRDQRV